MSNSSSASSGATQIPTVPKDPVPASGLSHTPPHGISISGTNSLQRLPPTLTAWMKMMTTTLPAVVAPFLPLIPQIQPPQQASGPKTATELTKLPWIVLTTYDNGRAAFRPMQAPTPLYRPLLLTEQDSIAAGPQSFHRAWEFGPVHTFTGVPEFVTRGYPRFIPETIPRPERLTDVPLCIPVSAYQQYQIFQLITDDNLPGVSLAEWAKYPNLLDHTFPDAVEQLEVVDPLIKYSWPGYDFDVGSPIDACVRGSFKIRQLVTMMTTSLNHWVAAASSPRDGNPTELGPSFEWEIGPGCIELQDIYLIAVAEFKSKGGRNIWMPVLSVGKTT